MTPGAAPGARPTTGYALPRLDDPALWSRMGDDLVPRFVMLRFRVRSLDLRWGVPLWALEETLRFALLTLPWVAYGWRRLPESWRRLLGRPGRRAAIGVDRPARPPWDALEALLDGHGTGLLRMERGTPFVHVEAKSGDDRVVVEVTQV